MRKPDANEISLVTLGMTQTLTLWTVLAPSVHDVRNADPVASGDTVSSLRTTEAVVGSIALVIASTASVYTKSPVPLIVTGLTVLGLVLAYELTLRNTNTIKDASHV